MITIKSGIVNIFLDSINIQNREKNSIIKDPVSGVEKLHVSDGIFRQYLNLCMEHAVM